MLRKHLVIVGGGWAGLALVRSLKKVNHNKLRITLISDEPNFRYSPGMYRVATGHREHEAILPIHEVIEDISHVDFVVDSAKSIDRKSRIIKTVSGKIYHYDYAVLALGMVSSYFGIPGIKENSFSIKSTKGVRKFKAHLHQELTDDKAPDKNYVIVGAGPTGIELAAALGAYMKKVAKWHKIRRKHISIELIEAAPRVAPTLSEKVSKKIKKRLSNLGIKVMVSSKVESETTNTLTVSGKSLPTHTVIWTAGVTNNPFYTRNSSQFNVNERGKILVDEHLMVDNHTYVIGDNAATLYSGLALTAVHDARFVAKDILRALDHKPRNKHYKPLKPAAVIPVGSKWAIMQYGSLVISGLPGSILRSLADFVGYKDVLGFWKALEVWLRSNEKEEACKVCRTELALLNEPSGLLELS